MRFWTWLLARLAVAIVLVGWVFSALILPPAGDAEFHRSLDALKTIKSVHLTMISDIPSQRTEQEAYLSCANDSFRRITHTVIHQPEKDFDLNIAVVRSGGQDYQLQNDGTWKRGYSGTESPAVSCGRLAQGTRAWIAPDIQEMLDHGIIDKGDKKTVDGYVCREWKVTMRIGVAVEHRTLCIGTKDHLPREMATSFGNTKWTYAFNVPVSIEAPTNLTPEPQRDTYQPPPPGLSLANDDDSNR